MKNNNKIAEASEVHIGRFIENKSGCGDFGGCSNVALCLIITMDLDLELLLLENPLETSKDLSSMPEPHLIFVASRYFNVFGFIS